LFLVKKKHKAIQQTYDERDAVIQPKPVGNEQQFMSPILPRFPATVANVSEMVKRRANCRRCDNV
jgi:hypothetical protein